MAKIYGLFGSMTGKLADTVMAVRNGEQLARKYQPIVFNPSTPAQIAQRAKLKLLSQLSAVCAPVIAMRRQGSVTARNLFTKKNFGAVTYSSNTASVDINKLQLTNSVVGIPQVAISRITEDNLITAFIDQPNIEDIDRVVFCFFEKQDNNHLRFITSKVATEMSETFYYGVNIPIRDTSVVVLAYGVRDNNENARVTFGNLEAVTAEQVAKLITTSVLTETDITLTETTGATLEAVTTINHDMRAEKKSKK